MYICRFQLQNLKSQIKAVIFAVIVSESVSVLVYNCIGHGRYLNYQEGMVRILFTVLSCTIIFTTHELDFQRHMSGVFFKFSMGWAEKQLFEKLIPVELLNIPA
jgi:hypothetical protein